MKLGILVEVVVLVKLMILVNIMNLVNLVILENLENVEDVSRQAHLKMFIPFVNGVKLPNHYSV